MICVPDDFNKQTSYVCNYSDDCRHTVENEGQRKPTCQPLPSISTQNSTCLNRKSSQGTLKKKHNEDAEVNFPKFMATGKGMGKEWLGLV